MKVLFVAPLGNFNVTDGGYGNASLGILKVLQKMCSDKSISLITEVDCLSTLNLNSFKLPDKEYDVILVVASVFNFLNPSISNIFEKILKLGKRKYLSIVWETEPLPKVWDTFLKSDLFDGYIIPSYFVGKQLITKTIKPVYYVPHYIDCDLFKPINIEDKDKEKNFIVLFIGQNTLRKSLNESILAYVRAMHTKKNSRLIIKAHAMSNKELPLDQIINYHISTNCSIWSSHIDALPDKLNGDDMVKLYRNSSLLLFPSKGEGFGLPVAEAMSVGLPVVYIDWSATPEVISETPGNIAVDYYIDETTNMNLYGYEYGSQYAYPKIRSLTDAIRDKYNQWEKDKKSYYEEVQNNRSIIDYKFGYNSIKNCIMNVLLDKQEDRIVI